MAGEDDFEDIEENENEGSQEDEGHEGDEDAAGQDAGEGEGTRRPGEEDADGSQQEVRRNRASDSVREAKRAAKEAREQLATKERELSDLRAAQVRTQHSPDPAVEAARLELMTPEERIEYRLQQSEARHAQELRALRWETAEREDKARFERFQQDNPRAKRYVEDVEKLLDQARRGGTNLPRETVFYYLLGKKVAENTKNKGATTRQAGRENVRREQTRPSAGRGDVGTGARKGKSLEERLANVEV